MLYHEALAVDRHTATVGSRRDLRNRLVAGAVVALAGVFVVYLLAVRTRWGQDFENAALAGARQHASGSWYGDADRWLNRLTAESFGVSLLVIAAVGLVRRRLLLALCGVLTAVGAVAAARVMKAALPSRPTFEAAPVRTAHAPHAIAVATQTTNTLPSGHTAAAMGLFFATLIVISRRWYVPVTVLALPGAALAGVATVAADWHRVSDTVAADLLALTVGLLGLAVVAQLGLVRPGPPLGRSSPGQRLLYTVLLAVATTALAVGAAFFVRYHGAPSSVARYDAAYWSAQAFALGAAVTAAGAMLAVCRHLVSVGTRPPRPLTILAS